MSELSKHTLTINISDRIEWIDKRCGLTEIQKDYITAQMKEAVSEAVQQANGVTTGTEQCNLPDVSQQSELLNDFLVKLRRLLNFTHSRPLPKYVEFYLKGIL